VTLCVTTALAILLLQLSLLMQFLPTSSGTTLPSCCRRDGKHRCGMTAQAGGAKHDPGTPEVRANAKCLLYPSFQFPATTSRLDAALPSSIAFEAPAPVWRVAEPGSPLYRNYFSTAGQGRAPPTSLSSLTIDPPWPSSSRGQSSEAARVLGYRNVRFKIHSA
jgi:hypothetical protein